MLDLALIYSVKDQGQAEHYFQHVYPMLDGIQRNYVRDLASYGLLGYCPACGVGEVQIDYMFSADGKTPVWRERGVCRCGLNTRMRATLDWIVTSETLNRTSVVYCSEGKTAFYKALLDFLPLTIGSEYIPNQAPLGSVDRHGLRCESLEQLSFADDSFDLLVSLDVLEHVFDFEAALDNMLRVLKPGGVALVTVPFQFGRERTQRRAEVDAGGRLVHRLPPVYHGDPISGVGALLVYDFGWDLIDYAKAIGFRDVEFLFIWSEAKKYLGINYILRMRK
ncbi:class I SAM-dependent methyltransferase [Parasulfuritortus cantonensis]|uniref:Class I SAM-dependent methyltransferase n=1 Tax=Parasulfuritortus cantonensis TaxID=2528202 RepID=A0A4R1BKU8_9PROT|nr:class I SAM-dependent methyltransferase [Parasulfuritortus cantonensis]TCJ17956.1 class I SAM-dependent methyltransferase [Parasulfuritortus cantonensis]